jgi:serine protease SohB
MEFLIDYGLFLAKLLTIAVVVAAVGGVFALSLRRRQMGREGQLQVVSLNRKYEAMELTLKAALLPRKAFKRRLKELKGEYKRRERAKANAGEARRRRVFVLNFEGDVWATAVASLREEISSIILVATPQDEVVLLLESRGGTVHGYGLAASQLRRLREREIPLTVAVDSVAASGGYLMACVANRIIAAPFAIVGSIGVVTALPNFHRFLRSHDIDFEQITAGEFKRTLSLFGENTEKGRAKVREEVEVTHRLFKEFVQTHRPQVDIAEVATGEHWYGQRALALRLVDTIQTSDDYLREALADADLYAVSYRRKRGLLRRLFS